MLTSMAIILIAGIFFGTICNKMGLPSLIGMIIAGIIIGPHMLSLLDPVILELSAQLRQVALVIVLTRAGLSLNIQDLVKVGRAAILLCFVPATLEIMGIVLLAPLILGISIIESILMGCVLAAVSPAVIVPRMIKMIDEGYGVGKRIPQMLLAGVSVDDVYVIVLFTSAITVASGGNITAITFWKIPISIGVGIIVGFITSVLYLKIIEKITIPTVAQVLLLLSISFLLLELEEQIVKFLPMSALLAIMSMALTIYQKKKTTAIYLADSYKKLWVVAEIVLFILVGASVNIAYLRINLGVATIVVMCGLIFRMLGVWLSTGGQGLENKERAFCMVAYTPKATVQAAIGGIPLAMGLPCGEIILTTAVISILLTAPVGAIGIDNLVHRLTSKENL